MIFMSVKRSILKSTKHGECGIVDTLRQLIYNNHNYDENLRLLKLILKPFLLSNVEVFINFIIVIRF